MANNEILVDKYRPSQGPAECAALLAEVGKIKPKVILEIGVHLGRSLALWNEAFKPEILIGIDNDAKVSEVAAEMTKSKHLPEAFHYLAPYDSIDLGTWNKVSDILGGRTGKKIDFLFIDGDHRYSTVKYDYRIYAPIVRKGGIIAIHDVALEGEQWFDLVETKQLFDELDADKKLIHSDGTGCGVIYV